MDKLFDIINTKKVNINITKFLLLLNPYFGFLKHNKKVYGLPIENKFLGGANLTISS